MCKIPYIDIHEHFKHCFSQSKTVSETSKSYSEQLRLPKSQVIDIRPVTLLFPSYTILLLYYIKVTSFISLYSYMSVFLSHLLLERLFMCNNISIHGFRYFVSIIRSFFCIAVQNIVWYFLVCFVIFLCWLLFLLIWIVNMIFRYCTINVLTQAKFISINTLPYLMFQWFIHI